MGRRGYWSDALITRGPTGQWDGACDPFVAVDATGRVYATYLANTRSGWGTDIYSQTSVDSGRTWSEPVAVCPSTEIDKPVSACDISPESPYRNNFYVIYCIVWGGTFVARSTDGGATFVTPTRASPLPGGEGYEDTGLPYVCIGPSGEVNAIWIDSVLGYRIVFRRSTDGGASFPDTLRTVASFSYRSQTNPCGRFRIPTCPVLACDISGGVHRGWLYACWQYPATDGTDPDIFFTRSTNNGTTWSVPMVISDDSTHRWQWWPSMAVDPVSGYIGVSWLDRREDATGCRYACWGTISTDGGTTWAANVRISYQLSDPTNSTFLGDYIGTTISSHGFYSTWPDLRNDAGDVYGAWWNTDPLTLPLRVTAYCVGNDIRLTWHGTSAHHYRIYSAPTADGPFDTLEGSTAGTTFNDIGAANDSVKFYIVRASTEP